MPIPAWAHLAPQPTCLNDAKNLLEPDVVFPSCSLKIVQGQARRKPQRIPSLLSTARRHGLLSMLLVFAFFSKLHKGSSGDKCFLDAQRLWLCAEGARPEQLLGSRKLTSGHVHAHSSLPLHFNDMSGGGICLCQPPPRTQTHTTALRSLGIFWQVAWRRNGRAS